MALCVHPPSQLDINMSTAMTTQNAHTTPVLLSEYLYPSVPKHLQLIVRSTYKFAWAQWSALELHSISVFNRNLVGVLESNSSGLTFKRLCNRCLSRILVGSIFPTFLIPCAKPGKLTYADDIPRPYFRVVRFIEDSGLIYGNP